MADDLDDPMTPSGDTQCMMPFWHMVDAIREGAEAMRMPSGGGAYSSMSGPSQPVSNLKDLRRGQGPTFPQSPYLPAMANESWLDYESRRKHAPFTNIYEEISDNLAGRPFSRECQLDDKEPEDLKKLSENIDGQGHNLHVFAKSTFKDGLDKGIDWIFIDYPRVAPNATLADERSMGARPYWVKVDADRMLAVYSAVINGVSSIYHARIYEPVKVQSGYGEECVERVRVLNREAITDIEGEIIALGPATWTLLEKTEQDDGGKKTTVWIKKAEGEFTIGVIPLVPFIPVGRCGNTWKVTPAFHDIAHMQVEEFQQESNLKTIKELTAFPMLSGNGVSQPTDANGDAVVVPVGPRAVLFAPMGGDGKFGNWTFIEPSAQSLTFLATDLEKHRTEMRNLGRQPLATANLTVVTTANVAMKAHNAVQAWAYLLKDALEQAWIITCKWLKQDRQPVVNVHTDFDVDYQAGTELDALLKAEGQGVLSKRTVQDEFKRRGVLSDDFDPDEEEQQLAEEQQGLQPEQAIDPATGELIQPTTRPKLLKPTVN